MPFQPKPTKVVGRGDWAVEVPRPPKHATHARMTFVNDLKENGKPKVATLPIQDFGCFKGVAGDFIYIRQDNRGKVSEEYKGQWSWNGCQVEGIEDYE